MITKEQVSFLSKKKNISEAVIFREYLQLFFLNELYSQGKSRDIFFKGGTALHLIYKAPRFSEDLDFTVGMDQEDFISFIKELFDQISKNELITFRNRESLSGKRFLLKASPDVLGYEAFVNLDFSFREKVIQPEKSIIKTNYPVLFTSYIHHLSKDEIFSEKIRALLSRNKGRDLYDLWYLKTQGAEINKDLVRKKLKYYHLENIKKEDILKKVEEFSKEDFILDIRPFVPINEREKLGDFLNFIKDYLKENL
jgi:predicted nucleotidyltransferase component of viral defense system